MIVGQINNKQIIEKWKREKSFPRFIIVTGEPGCGKYTMANYIARQGISGYVIEVGNKVDEVREAIKNAYKCTTPTTYIFRNTDTMSTQAKNALLKVTEEPPRRAYFIMTAIDINNTLPTLKSRGTEVRIENYTPQDLLHFTNDQNILDIARTPGQVKQLQEMDVKEFIAFCNKVLDNIGKVTGVNAFKIGNSFKFKDTDDGYDVTLFFNAIKSICEQRAHKLLTNNEPHDRRYFDTIVCCSKYHKDFNTTGLKKDSTFDMWILELRDIWR